MISNVTLSPVAFWSLTFAILALFVRIVTRRRQLLVRLPGPPRAGWIKGHFSSLIGSGSVAFQEKIIAEYGPTLKLNGGFGLRYAVGIQNQQAEEVIQTRQALISSGNDLSSQAGRGRDIMTLLMKANEVAGSESYVGYQDMVGHMNTFIFAGHETTSTAVARILDVLADRPRVQVRLREEIRKYFENNQNDTHYDGLLELPYLDAVVRETLRLHGPVSFLNRICEEDTILPLQYPVETPSGKITNIPIKKGTRVFMSISASNKYGRIWGERAHEFLPERWIGNKIDEVTQSGAHLPGVYSSMMTFGAGSRACIGFKFAIMEIKVMIAELVKDFKFEPSQEEHNWEIDRQSPLSTYTLQLNSAAWFIIFAGLWLVARVALRPRKLAIPLPGPPAAGWIKGHFPFLVGSGSIGFQEKIMADYGPTLKLNGGFGEELILTSDSAAIYSVLMPVFMGIAKQTCQGIQKELKVLNNSSKEVDVFYWTTVAALELVGEAGLGYSFSSFSGERNEYNTAIKSVLQVFTKFVPFMTLMPLLYRIGTPSFREWALRHIPHRDLQRLRYAVGIQNAQAEEVLRAREALISSGGDLSSQAGRGCDIVTLLSEKDGSEFYVDHQELVGHMNTFIFGGHETTSSAVARILDIIANQPRVQARLREEISQYFENNPNDTNYDGLLELPYLDGVVRETLRLHAPAVFMNRTCEKDTVLPLQCPIETQSGKIASIPIKKGTRVFISISASNRDERVWGEHAHEFKPERWIGSKIDEITQPGSHVPGIYSSMMTFGAGPRACIGFKFAIMEIKVMIAELVKDFKFEPSQETYQWETFNIQAPYLQKDAKNPARVPKLPLKVIPL
ncbi:unnamed protein product [Rhizoctonia solani]|uniref:Cytochrome P450 family protein n=1 Tax=Rhizoctonia solani TaxID=456999 RepID=A0A8H3HRE7_9AGAM|nr:unnamed protein product [Rhizoctonia solani]